MRTSHMCIHPLVIHVQLGDRYVYTISDVPEMSKIRRSLVIHAR